MVVRRVGPAVGTCGTVVPPPVPVVVVFFGVWIARAAAIGIESASSSLLCRESPRVDDTLTWVLVFVETRDADMLVPPPAMRASAEVAMSGRARSARRRGCN